MDIINVKNTKKILIVLLAASLVFGGVALTLKAQSRGTDNSAENIEKTKTRNVSSSSASPETSTGHLKNKELVRTWLWITVRRFQATMDRLAKIADRIDSRKNKIEKTGVEVKGVEQKLSTVRSQISKGGDNIIIAAAELKDISKGAPVAPGFQDFKEYVDKSKSNLKRAKQNLKEALNILKNATAKKKSP